MKQLTKEQAIAFAENRLYEGLSARQIAEFQMEQELLCMPFEVFHAALEKALDRPVYTHEIARNYKGLLKELYGENEPLTLEKIIRQIPEDKRILIQL